MNIFSTISQKTKSYLIIISVLAISIFCAFKITELKFDYNFEAFFPNEDNELGIYETHRNRFEWDNEFVLLGIENKEGIFKKDFLKKINELSLELKSIPNIDRVISPTTIKNISISGLVPIEKKLMHIDDETLYKEDSINIYSTPELIGSFFPSDAKSISIYIKTDENLSKLKSDSLAKNIEKAFSKYHFDEVHFVGRIVAQDVYLKNLQTEFIYFLSISFVLVIIFLWFSFKSFYGILLPLIIVLLSVLFTLGVMALTGKSLDLMTVMLPTMIFIAGMSDVVHFFSKYFEELQKGTSREKIYPLIIKEVGFPTLLTLITTVVGFLSLLFSSIIPIRDFGIYTSVGIVIAFILTYTLLPALLHVLKPKQIIIIHQRTKGYEKMQNILFWLFRNQKTIVVAFSILTVVSVIGIYKIKVNNILLEDLSDGVKIKQDFVFFDKHYSGVRPLELAIEVTDSSKTVWDYDVIKQLNALDNFLKKTYKAGFLYSPAMLVKTINKSLNDNLSSTEFPSEEDYQEIKKELLKNKKNKDIKRIVTTDAKHARISGKINDEGSIVVNEKNKALYDFIEHNINSNQLKIQITGAGHLVDRNNQYMVSNMVKGFLFSFVITAILTYILHRSWRMVIIFLIPNTIPLLIIAGIMGFLGIELKAATSLVFSIAFGIATDDTIHFISRLKIELGYKKTLLYAFKRTFFETGKPILLTSFILTGGFISLTISDFQSTFYFGFLLCITMLVALLADVFLLPVLLFWLLGKKKNK